MLAALRGSGFGRAPESLLCRLVVTATRPVRRGCVAAGGDHGPRHVAVKRRRGPDPPSPRGGGRVRGTGPPSLDNPLPPCRQAPGRPSRPPLRPSPNGPSPPWRSSAPWPPGQPFPHRTGGRGNWRGPLLGWQMGGAAGGWAGSWTPCCSPAPRPAPGTAPQPAAGRRGLQPPAAARRPADEPPQHDEPRPGALRRRPPGPAPDGGGGVGAGDWMASPHPTLSAARSPPYRSATTEPYRCVPFETGFPHGSLTVILEVVFSLHQNYFPTF